MTGFQRDVSRARAFTAETSRARQVGLACRTVTSRLRTMGRGAPRCDPQIMEHIISPSPSTVRRALRGERGRTARMGRMAGRRHGPDRPRPGPRRPGVADVRVDLHVDHDRRRPTRRSSARLPPHPASRTSPTRASRTPSSPAPYYDDAKGRGLDPDEDCADLSDSEGQYHTSSGRQGRLACSTAHHESTITWTDDTVVATATGKNDERLYKWWDKLVGRTLTDAQHALLSGTARRDPALGSVATTVSRR